MKTLMPPGDYWLDDPARVVGRAQWALFLAALGESQHLDGYYAGQRVCAFHIGGDGGCRSANGLVQVGTDTGLVALVPKALAHADYHGRTGVTFNQPTECGIDGGSLWFGSTLLLIEGQAT